MSKFFITTAIDYTNGEPHLGHAYEKVLADVIARYHRLAGDDVFFLTGVDQHGQKVQQSARALGVEPKAFVDELTPKFTALWKKLELSNDGWAATTDAAHQAVVRTILQRLWDERDAATGKSKWIYQARRDGYYSVRQEQFLTEKERGPDGKFGPEWGEVEFREEENYYFRLESSRQWLLDLIDARAAAGEPLVLPLSRQNELRNAVEKLGGDLCISRPKSRLSWGIELPFDQNYVTFVWFDALVNYLSFAPGYDATSARPPETFLAWWRSAVHLIGKDILIPAHGVYWPIMLHALGFADDEIPTLLVHGWWTVNGEKMSKSLGNVIDPNDPADRFGAEALRYFLVAESAPGRDADYTEERLIGRYNTDLANSLGNLLNRSLNMTCKYREGVLRLASAPAGLAPLEAYVSEMNACQVQAGIQFAQQMAATCNQLVDSSAPWKLAKDPAKTAALDEVLYQLAESLRIIAILISPVLPLAAHGIFDQLNWKTTQDRDDARFKLSEATWGGLPDGHRVNAPTPLFPRIESKAAV